MMTRSQHTLPFLIIVITSLLFTFNLFTHSGEPATFDGPTHITQMQQVSDALRGGEFPVTWLQKFAHYGSPIPMYAQQTTTYLGALLILIVGNPVLSSKILALLFSIIGGWGMYVLLRKHVDILPAMAGTLLFMFTPYRILNVYVRGAFPEFAAQSLVPYILLSINLFLEEKAFKYLAAISLTTALLILTHTFMIVIALPILLFYTVALTHKKKQLIPIILAGGLGIGLAAFYLFPLITEVKYFYYGLEPNHYKEGQLLQLKNFFSAAWPYLTAGDRFTRPHILLGGLIEGITLTISLGYFGLIKRKYSLGLMMSLCGLVYVVLMLPISEPLYRMSSLLGNIQHPWRMLAGYTLTVPFLAAIGLQSMKPKLILVLCTVVMLFATPNVFAKNYTIYPQSHYSYTRENLHGNAMVTMWAGEPEDYPDVKEHVKVIEVKAKIKTLHENNTRRSFEIHANSDARFVAYTFYFPGWEILSDGQQIPIEFQDMNYRGLITFRLSKGDHTITMQFIPTRKRQIGYLLSVISIVLLALSSVVYRKYEKILS